MVWVRSTGTHRHLFFAIGLALLLAAGCRAPQSSRNGAPPTPSARTAKVPASTPSAPARPASPVVDGPGSPPDLTWCTIEFVVDADTIDVEDCEDEGRIRLILVDAPESNARCFSAEATAYLREVLPVGSSVGLERDVSELDKYGRKLRYAWNAGGMVNEALVREGHAWVSVFPPDVAHRDLLLAAQAEARAARRGVWGDCQKATAADGACDPSYPTVCIPKPPPALDCRELPYRSFAALPPDPHHLDGDGDGLACETP